MAVRYLLLAGLFLFASASPLQETEDLPPTVPTPIDDSHDFSGAQVLKVVNGRTPLLEKFIEDENVDVWASNATHLDILVPKKKVDSVKNLLAENKIDYSIMIENLQRAIDDQNPETGDEDEDELDGRRGHRMNWEKYQRLETIYGYLDYLVQTYPGVASVGVLGQSTEGKPIKYIKVSSGKPNARAVLIDGGIHAREWISPAAVTYIIRQVTENRDSLPSELRDLDFYIIPVLNPDGYEYTHTYSRMWRKNRARGFGCSGVDLNRNFKFHWGGKGTSGNTCSEIYRGASPGSEPETRALEGMVTGLNNLKESWKDTEMKLIEKLRNSEQQKLSALQKSNNEIANLKEKIRKAEEKISVLQLELKTVKDEKSEYVKMNDELTVEVTRLNCEIDEYKKEMEEWKKSENEKIAAMESNATIQGKLSQANTEVTRKQTEIVRLNGLIGQLRGELEKIRLGSVINQSAENLTGTISQLQAALAIERENSKDIVKEKDAMSKEILDLRRQVKEMENILIKRSKSGSNIPLGDVFNADSYEFKELEKKYKALHSELTQAQASLALKEQLFNDLQSKYDQDILKLEQELKKLKKESSSLKQSVEERERVQKPLTAAKEDAHLLATIRGLKSEISSRDRDIIKLNRELDDVRKTNKRLQREREKALNAGNKYRGLHVQKDVDKSPRVDSDQSSSKEYNAAVFEDEEAVIFLRSENKNLKEEIRKLEQDLISLHNKRIQDLSDLQEQHETEITRMVREHAAKHSSSTVAHLQGQVYTQQMVIHHLKEQVKMLEERAEEATMLKAERDHLENSLIEANKKIARLHEIQSPESLHYSELLEKLDFLERRHEIREQKLQSIVRDLINKQGQGLTCSSDCRDKLLNKNREICYYRAEMDKILDTLAEFRWNK